MKTSNIQRPTSNVQSPLPTPVVTRRAHWMSDVPLSRVLLISTLAATALAEPPIRITNREFTDGSGGSSRKTDPEKRQSVETFYDGSGRPTKKAVYKLDERLQPESAIFYNANGVVFQKSTYKLDAEDRIIQEVIYDAKDNLLGTKNYRYGMKNGKAIVVEVDVYDSNGNLIQTPRRSSSKKAR
jgi:hypothetical protein